MFRDVGLLVSKLGKFPESQGGWPLAVHQTRGLGLLGLPFPPVHKSVFLEDGVFKKGSWFTLGRCPAEQRPTACRVNGGLASTRLEGSAGGFARAPPCLLVKALPGGGGGAGGVSGRMHRRHRSPGDASEAQEAHGPEAPLSMSVPRDLGHVASPRRSCLYAVTVYGTPGWLSTTSSVSSCIRHDSDVYLTGGAWGLSEARSAWDPR